MLRLSFDRLTKVSRRRIAAELEDLNTQLSFTMGEQPASTGQNLVLRLKHPVSEGTLERLRSTFGDILVSGTFEQGPPLPVESDEYPDLTRLRFHFNRRNMGRLRQLIDTINQEPA